MVIYDIYDKEKHYKDSKRVQDGFKLDTASMLGKYRKCLSVRKYAEMGLPTSI